MTLTFVKHEKIYLKDHPDFNEAWLRDRIVDDPSILGLGDLEIKDVEKSQPPGGRLDILLYDTETEKRYELELMLGTVNESHIIRCIEYWDVERKRYPQYDHAAVLVAEEITTRFLNVMGLFNSSIPMIAIQLDALKLDDKIMLNFTKVLDEIIPGDDIEGGGGETVDRDYWEKKGSKESLEIADNCIEIINEFEAGFKLTYKKHYIGLAMNNHSNLFILFRGKKQFLKVEAKISNHEPWVNKLEEAGIGITPSKSGGRIHFQLKKRELKENHDLLREFFKACYQENQEQ